MGRFGFGRESSIWSLDLSSWIVLSSFVLCYGWKSGEISEGVDVDGGRMHVDRWKVDVGWWKSGGCTTAVKVTVFFARTPRLNSKTRRECHPTELLN